MFGRNKKPYGFYSLAFLAGAIAGAAVALLYAPMNGRKLQNKIKETLDEQVENVQNVVRRVVSA